MTAAGMCSCSTCAFITPSTNVPSAAVSSTLGAPVAADCVTGVGSPPRGAGERGLGWVGTWAASEAASGRRRADRNEATGRRHPTIDMVGLEGGEGRRAHGACQGIQYWYTKK